MYKILLFLVGLVNPLLAEDINIKEVLEKNPNEVLVLVDKIKAPNTSFLMNIEVIDENLLEKTKATFNLLVGANNEKSFAIYKTPATQKGNTILSIGNNIWIYITGTKNPIKISPQQKLIGQASVADVVSLLYAANYNVVSYQKEKDNYILKLEAKNTNVSYAKLDLIISNQAMPKQAIFYALSGKQIKTMFFNEVKEIAGRYRPSSMRIEDFINNNLVTTVKYQDITEKKIPSAHFNKDNIAKLSTLY